MNDIKNFNQNNLVFSSSPYLLQHTENPIFWQEWTEEVLAHAKENEKLIFVSIGYSSCHWCHVMAQESFSDQATADYLNEHFVSIKVDREQRPDIDEYFMNFISRTTGQGGWPLNVVLDSDTNPFFAGTYFPPEPKHGLPTLTDMLTQVRDWYLENKNAVTEFSFNDQNDLAGTSESIKDEATITEYIHRDFDEDFAGFGRQTKFPPYSTLLLLLNIFQDTNSSLAEGMIIKTLNTMTLGGLHDHLQGGFFRYCVDREWTIPHFEKMLYDQAMHLWVYSLAYKLFGRAEDKKIIDSIITCLSETFSDGDGLFYSSHDADTEHIEGATYVWTIDELKEILDDSDFIELSRVYDINPQGNFEGSIHLLKKEKAEVDIGGIEKKLLMARKQRAQPFVDKKVVTSWNALTGIGLLLASRYTEDSRYKEMADRVFSSLHERHVLDDKLAHSSLGPNVQRESFLEDYAALLLFTTYLIEDADSEPQIKKYEEYIASLSDRLKIFKAEDRGGHVWFSKSKGSDFKQIPASSSDHPTPSAISLVEMALFRAKKILGGQDAVNDFNYEGLLQKDFYNVLAMYGAGKFHEIHSPEKIDWKNVPINGMVIKDKKYQDCTAHACREYSNKIELLNSLNRP